MVIWNVCVVIVKVKVRWDVACILSSEIKAGQLVEVGAQVLCGFKEVTVLEVVTGNEDVEVLL